MLHAVISGRLVRDARSKTSKNGIKYLLMSLRVDFDEYNETPVWLSVYDFDDSADIKDFVEGVWIYAEGRLSPSKWIGKDGKEHISLTLLTGQVHIAEIGRRRSPNVDTRRNGELQLPLIGGGGR